MLDRDLTEMYHTETKYINRVIKRNIDRFPEDVMFQLTANEWDILMSQIAISSLRLQNTILNDNRGKHRKYLSYVFAKQGISSLVGVIKNDTVTKVHDAITRIFVEMRRFIVNHHLLLQRLKGVER